MTLRRSAGPPVPPDVTAFLLHLEKERQVAANTVLAYRRDLEAFVEFLNRHYAGDWDFGRVDRLGIRGFLGEMQRRGLAKRSMARALSAVRSLYRFLQAHHGLERSPVRAAKVPKQDRPLPAYLDRARTPARSSSAGSGIATRPAAGTSAAAEWTIERDWFSQPPGHC